MVVDASAVIAILRAELEMEIFLRAIVDAEETLMSAVNFNEACLVLAGRSGSAAEWQPLDALVRRAGMNVVPFDLDLATVARAAFLRFGKGRHPAALNLGDCAAYALAKARDLPLLFKGNDFTRTDIKPAIPPSR